MGIITGMNTKLKLAFFAFIVCCATAFSQGTGKFMVMLDPGHGGKDPGAGYHGFVEKHIALNVALKVGALLDKAGVEVRYTRKTDVFIELDERCKIANRVDASLFVSIHCNGEGGKKASGTETFVIGEAKNASQLEVAKKENSVISLEKDYKTKYEGFDPSKPETLIGLTIQNDESLLHSIDLARGIQSGFRGLGRKDRGVKQAPFWVLHRTAMPGILIELGFLSYKPEGEYLDSDAGQDELARAIVKAILAYKTEYYTAGITVNRFETTQQISAEPDNMPPSQKGTTFRIQIATSGNDLETVPSNFKGLKNITKDKSTSQIKYFYGDTSDRAQAERLLAEAKAKGYTSAFIATFKDGKKV